MSSRCSLPKDLLQVAGFDIAAINTPAREVVRESAGLPASGIVTAVREAVMTFCVQAPQFDDITIQVRKVL